MLSFQIELGIHGQLALGIMARTRPRLNKDLRFRIGLRLKKAREKTRRTQEEVAEDVGVSRNMVNLWEAGTSFPMPEKLLPLASLYGVSIDWVLGREESLRAVKEARGQYVAGAAWDDFTPEERAALETIIEALAERARRRREKE